MKLLLKRGWTFALGAAFYAVIVWRVFALPDPPPCTEHGPHTNAWECAQSGSVGNAGALDYTITNICADDVFAPPVLISSVTFNDGKKRRYIWWDCPANWSQNHYETNAVVYTAGSLYFSPSNIPNSFSTNGTFIFTAKVNGTASSSCGTVTGMVATVKIKVWSDAQDTDGDGVSDCEEIRNGTEPNEISFTTTLDPGDHVNGNSVTGRIEVLHGVPSQMAVLVNSTNFGAATWISFNTNITATLGTNDGEYAVWIGLRGSEESQQTWEWNWVMRDTVPPLIVITNPASSTTSLPMIQLQGYSPEALATIRFDLTNAAGLVVTNEEGFVSSQFWDTNLVRLTTNWFECLDVELTNGVNTVTLRVADLAGNLTVTNFSYTLDFSGDTTPPVASLYWPQDGAQIIGTNFTLRGLLDDPTAQLTAQIVDTNGVTNIVEAIVERDGLMWVEDLPLSAGTNTLTLITTDAATNTSVTNISVVKSAVELTIDDLPEITSLKISVSGTINTLGYTIWVNGTQATQNSGNGTWSADNVRLNDDGTATVQVRAIPDSDNGGMGNTNGAFGSPSHENPGNPGSASAADAQATREVDPRTIVLVYGSLKAITLFDNADFSDMAYQRHKQSIRWVFNSFGEETRHYFRPVIFGDDAYDCTTKIAWPAEDWSPSGEGTLLVECNTGVGSPYDGPPRDPEPHYGSPQIIQEHCRAYDLSATDVYTRGAKAMMQLRTGGKSLSKRKNLFTITGGAARITLPRWQGGSPVPAEPIDPERVTIGSLGKLGNDGRLYKVLADNKKYDVTPRVGGEKFYVFDVNGQKHKLRIRANGVELDPDKVNTTNCVGQKVTFTAAWDSDPPNVTATVYDWIFSFKYVNESWQHERYISLEQDGYWESYGSVNYRMNSDLLTNEAPFVWYVSGGNKNATLNVNLTFSNGQMVRLKEKGKFLMLRPHVTRVVPQGPFAAMIDTNGWPLLALENGPMVFTVYISKTYPGSFGITQLINYYSQTEILPPDIFIWHSSYGAYILDGSEFYDGETPVPLDSWPSEDEYPSGSSIYDPPGQYLGIVWASYEGHWRDYVRFTPSGQGSIPITLGRIDWNWAATAIMTNGFVWTVDSDGVDGPTLYQDDTFPEWTDQKSSPDHESNE